MKSTVPPVKIHLTTFYGPTMTLSETFRAQIFMRRGLGVNIAPETLTILNFFQRWWKAFFFTHLDISFDVWGNRVIFVNFWLSKVNLQLPDKRPRIKSASPWEPFLSLLAFSCLLFKGRAVPLYQRTKTQPWCFPSSSHSYCLKILLTGSLFLKPRSGSTPKFFCDTFKLVHLSSCQLTRSRLSSRR